MMSSRSRPSRSAWPAPRADNELADARYVVAVFGTDHHELELALDDGGVDLEQLVWHLDEPLADLSSLGFLALCELARRHVTVALSGQGADELLGGYRKHRMAALVGGWQRVPRVLRAPGELAARRLGPRLPGSPGRTARALARAGPGGAPARHERAARPGAARPARARPAARGARGRGAARDRRRASTASPRPAAGGAAPRRAARPGRRHAHYFDRASMAHSLEVRVPFLDHHVVEYCATIPAELKVAARCR